MMSKMTDLTIRAWSLLTCGQRPRSFRQLFRDLRTDDVGSVSTETVIIIAGFAALAIGVCVVITTLVMDKAHSIHL